MIVAITRRMHLYITHIKNHGIAFTGFEKPLDEPDKKHHDKTGKGHGQGCYCGTVPVTHDIAACDHGYIHRSPLMLSAVSDWQGKRNRP